MNSRPKIGNRGSYLPRGDNVVVVLRDLVRIDPTLSSLLYSGILWQTLSFLLYFDIDHIDWITNVGYSVRFWMKYRKWLFQVWSMTSSARPRSTCPTSLTGSRCSASPPTSSSTSHVSRPSSHSADSSVMRRKIGLQYLNLILHVFFHNLNSNLSLSFR